MRRITSPAAFKTSYIAQVKEELGYKVRRAHNRRTKERKCRVPPHLRRFIEMAILEMKKQSIKPTYKMVQEKAFELYQKYHEENPRVKKFRGIFQDDPEIVKKIAEDEEIEYED